MMIVATSYREGGEADEEDLHPTAQHRKPLDPGAIKNLIRPGASA
jgi:hypothetical protein